MPIFIISASAYLLYRIAKLGFDQPEENRLMVCYDDDCCPFLIPEPTLMQQKQP